MADTIVDRLFVAFGLKTDGVKTGMTKAEGIIKNGLFNIKSYLMPLVTGFALSSMVQGFVSGAAEVAKAAERLGMSVEDLQAWQGVVQSLGADSKLASDMLGVVNEKLVDAAKMGGAESLKLFQKMGVSVKDSAGNMRSAADIVLDLAAASEKLGRTELYGYSKKLGLSPEMIDILVKGRKGLQDLLKAQKELAVFQKEDAELAQKGRIAWQALMKALQSVQAVIMRSVMPGLTLFTTYFAKAVVWARNNQPFMIALVTGFALAITTTLIPAIAKLTAAGIAAMAPWLPLIAVITAVALAVDDFWTYLEGGESALAPVWAYLIKFFGFFEMSIEGVKKYWQNFCDFWASVFTGNWEKACQSFIGMFQSAVQIFYGLWQGIGTYILDLINTVTGGAVDTFKAKFTAMLDWAKNAWNNVKDFFGFGGGESEKETVLPAMQLDHKSPLYSISPEELAKLSGNTKQSQTNNITSSASIGSITINTQATDAAGIAKSLRPELSKQMSSLDLVMASNTGVIAK